MVSRGDFNVGWEYIWWIRIETGRTPSTNHDFVLTAVFDHQAMGFVHGFHYTPFHQFTPGR